MTKWLLKTLVLLLILAAAYAAWPRYSVEQLEEAARAEDMDRLQRYIDFPELRGNMQLRLQRHLRESVGEDVPEEWGDLLIAGSNLFMGPLLRQLVTPEGIAELMRGGKDLRAFERELYSQQRGSSAAGPDAGAAEGEDWQLLEWQLTGFNSAEADYGEGGVPQLRLLLQRQGLRWRLVDIVLLENKPDSERE